MAIYKTKKPTKDGRTYYFADYYTDYSNVRKKYISKCYKTRKECEDAELKFKVKTANQEFERSSITFKELFTEYIIKKEGQIRTQSIYKIEGLYKYLERYNDLRVNGFDITKYNELYNYLLGLDISVVYKNKILQLMKSLLTFSNMYHGTTDSTIKYFQKIKQTTFESKEMDFFTSDEFKKFDSTFEYLDDWQVFFRVLYYLGLRRGEAMGIQFQDLDFERNTVRINKSVTTKIKGERYTINLPKTQNSIRTLPLPKVLREDLFRLYKCASKYPNYHSTWFVFGYVFPYTETTIARVKDRHCDLAGLRHIRIHDFRHSCASNLINKGASPTLVSKYLGHSSVKMTLDTYSHFYKSELETISNMLDMD